MSQLLRSLVLLFTISLSLSAKLTYGTLTVIPDESIDFDFLHTHQKVLSKPEFTLFYNDELTVDAPVQLFKTPSQPFLVYDREDHLGLNSLPESLEDTLLYEKVDQYRGTDSFIGVFNGFDSSERMIIQTDRGFTAVIQFKEQYISTDSDMLNPAYDSLDIEYWIGEEGDFDKITSTCFIDLNRGNQGEVKGLEWNRIHFSDGTQLDAFDQQREGALYYSVLSGWSGSDNVSLFRSADLADTNWNECRELPITTRGVDTISSFITDPHTNENTYEKSPVMLLYETSGDEMPSLFPNYSPVLYRDIFFAKSETTTFKLQIDSVVTDTAWGTSNHDIQVDVLSYSLKWATFDEDTEEFPVVTPVAVESSSHTGIKQAEPLALIVQGNQINLSRSLKRASIELFSVSGRRLFVGSIQGDSLILPSFSTGIYHYRIVTPESSYRGNMIIQ